MVHHLILLNQSDDMFALVSHVFDICSVLNVEPFRNNLLNTVDPFVQAVLCVRLKAAAD